MRYFPLSSADIVVITKTARFPVKGWKSLKPYKIGVYRGMKIVEQNVHGMRHIRLSNNRQIAQMIDIGRVDIGIVERFSAIGLFSELKLTELHILEPPIISVQVYHFLHRKHYNLISGINASLQELEKEGRIQKIREGYIHELKGGKSIENF